MTQVKKGRPRSRKSQKAILAATHALLNESGTGGLTIESIARRAGVGKPTIYRWWPTLADIVLEALLDLADTEIAVPESSSPRESLSLFLRKSMEALNRGSGVHLRFLMAQAQQDEAFRERFREHFVTARRKVLHSILLRATQAGRGAPVANRDLVVDMVFGAMWYRLLVGHAPLDEAFAEELTEAAMELLRVS